jgi:hypothetical protein
MKVYSGSVVVAHCLCLGASKGRMRVLFSSATAKLPCQSVRLSSTSTILRVATSGPGHETRKRTTPQVAGNPHRNANSPKSLSSVTTKRPSAWARSRTVSSWAPGMSTRAQTTSCPLARRASTAGPGKFSFARIRTV